MGAFKSPPDYRDLPASAVLGTTPLPDKYMLDIETLPRWNQKLIGSCTGHAGGKLKQYLDFKELNMIAALSPRFLYAMAKCEDGFGPEGTYPRLIAKTLKNYGCATEKTVPNNCDLTHEEYVYKRKRENIPKEAFDEAREFKIEGYAFPSAKDAEELKRSIKEKGGAMLLMRIGKEWWSPTYYAADLTPLKPPANVVSGHEIFLCGYEQVGNRTKFFILNSWGEQWADSGTAWFWFDEQKSFIEEAITFTDIPNEVAKQLSVLPTKESFRHSFNLPLKRGEQNKEVIALQTALMIEGLFSSDLYGELLRDGELGFYGASTAGALLAFQLKYKVAPVNELLMLKGETFGPKTRAKMTQIYG